MTGRENQGPAGASDPLRMANKALARERRLLAALMNHTPDHVYFKDGESRFIRISKSLADHFGLPDPGEAIGKTDFNFFSSEHAEQASADEQEIIKNGRAMVAKEEKETWPDGRQTWVSTTKVPLRDKKGRIVGTFGISRDISDRRRAEEQAREAQEALLEEQFRAREHAEAQLAKIRDELVRTTRLAAIGQMSASIAHDLRNPLGTIRNATYYLRGRLPDERAEVREYLGIIDEEVEAADRIIGNLLAIARARELVKQSVDLGRIVKEVFDGARRTDAMRLLMSLTPDPFIVRADADQLRQVIRNLVDNAVQAMRGRGELVVEAARDADGDKVVFRDTGPGIAPEARGSIFEPLVTTRTKGTGLGLTICRQIVEQHGGTIELIDPDKQGAAFRVRLPRD